MSVPFLSSFPDWVFSAILFTWVLWPLEVAISVLSRTCLLISCPLLVVDITAVRFCLYHLGPRVIKVTTLSLILKPLSSTYSGSRLICCLLCWLVFLIASLVLNHIITFFPTPILPQPLLRLHTI